ncbi:DUF1707 and DUF4870 domain-containing protein [Propionibacteriaceae bacterium Y2011]|uniref:DUF1707 and DUF4870 domain-containing protein n=1 Tax=Microlunatus sp. Y2014 TaxID=3418488 RepID=UPI003B4BA7DF
MSTPSGFEHPSLATPITEDERQRAETFLMDAYADGRINEYEFDRRIQLAIQANNRSELNGAFLGIVAVPSSGTSPRAPETVAHRRPEPGPYGAGGYEPGGYAGRDLAPHQAYAPLPQQSMSQQRSEGAGRATAAMGHFLALATSIVGPGIIFAITEKGSYARKEAAKSFNFQALSLVALIVVGILSIVLPGAIEDVLFGVVTLGWLLGTVIGGAKAAQGEDWTNPVRRLAKIEILPEK